MKSEVPLRGLDHGHDEVGPPQSLTHLCRRRRSDGVFRAFFGETCIGAFAVADKVSGVSEDDTTQLLEEEEHTLEVCGANLAATSEVCGIPQA